MLLKRKQSSATDFTQANLPHNRREVFFDVLKLHWLRFLSYGLLMVLFALPLHMVSISKDVIIGQMLENGLNSNMIPTGNLAAMLQVPCVLILSIGMAGMLRIIRQYAWGENVFFATDFAKGIKENGKQAVLLGFIGGILFVICVICYHHVHLTQGLLLAVIYMLPLGAAVVLGIPIAAYAGVCISIYNNGFMQILLMAIVVFLKSILKTAAALFCVLSPFLLLLIPNPYVQLLGRLVLTLLLPVMLLGWYLFASAQLDRHINREYYPQLVDRGIFPKETE